jgi:hypothetical protein
MVVMEPHPLYLDHLSLMQVVVAVGWDLVEDRLVQEVLAEAALEEKPLLLEVLEPLTQAEAEAALEMTTLLLAQAAPALSFSSGLKPYRSQTPLHLQEHG